MNILKQTIRVFIGRSGCVRESSASAYNSGSNHELLDQGVHENFPRNRGEAMNLDDKDFFDTVKEIQREYHESVTAEQFFSDLREAVSPRETYYDYATRVSKEQRTYKKYKASG